MKYLIVKPDNSVIDIGHWGRRDEVRWLVGGDDLPGSYLLDEDEARDLRESLGRATIVPGTRYYFVTGRAHGDDEATALYVGAQESRDAAVDEYRRQMWSLSGLNPVQASPDQGMLEELYIYIDSVICSYANMVEV